MAVPILSEEELERNRLAFQKRLKVEWLKEIEKVEAAVDARVREFFFTGRSLPYEVSVTVPGELLAGGGSAIFRDLDDYSQRVITVVRNNYGQAGWTTKVKRTDDGFRFVLGRKAR